MAMCQTRDRDPRKGGSSQGRGTLQYHPMDLVLQLIVFAIGLGTAAASHWGPGHHLEFAERVLRRRRELLPRGVARLLGEHADAYRYGNLAADLITVKAYGGHQNHCHRWTMIEAMGEHSTGSEEEQAFILGYLSHLAADTIAHNHFVPFHLVRFARGRGLGHLYWEMMADRFVADHRWDALERMQGLARLDQLDHMINASVPRKALTVGANRIIFDHVLLVARRRSWRRGMEKLHPVGRVGLQRGFLRTFQRASVQRIQLALRPRGLAKLSHLDTTGKAALKEAAKIRRQMVRRYASGEARDEAGQALAQSFLAGMESPPQGHRSQTPHW